MAEKFDLLMSHPRLARLQAIAGDTPGTTPAAKNLFHWLCHLAGENNRVQWIGNDLAAGIMGVDRHTVSRAIGCLLQQGLVSCDTPRLTPVSILTINESPTKLAKSKVPKESSDSLNDDERNQVCSSLANMSAYLCYGSLGLRTDDRSQLKPSQLNWMSAPGWTQENPCVDSWTVQHFMGYYWYLVSWQSDQQHIPLRLPDWGKLAKSIKETQLSRVQLFNFMREVSTWFPLIQYMTSGSKFRLVLNESSLRHPIVIEKIDVLRGMSEAELRAMWQHATQNNQPNVED